MIFINIILSIILYIPIPFLCGVRLMDVNNNNTKIQYFITSWLYGWLVMMSVYFILAFIITLMNKSLFFLTILWSICVILISISGAKICIKNFKSINFQKGSFKSLNIIIAFIILIQIIAVIFLQHTDDDDAWYVATAVTDWHTNTIGLYAADTGEIINWKSQADYIFAPWPVMCATFAQITGIHPTIIMHTVLPGLLLTLAYIVYWKLGTDLFSQTPEKTSLFLLIYAILNILGGFSVRSAAMFLLLRIWQGKAIMAAILLPLLFFTTGNYLKNNSSKTYMLLYINNIAILLVSSMGVILSGLILFCYSIMEYIFNKSLKTVVKLACILIPNLIIGSLYIFLKKAY